MQHPTDHRSNNHHPVSRSNRPLTTFGWPSTRTSPVDSFVVDPHRGIPSP